MATRQRLHTYPIFFLLVLILTQLAPTQQWLATHPVSGKANDAPTRFELILVASQPVSPSLSSPVHSLPQRQPNPSPISSESMSNISAISQQDSGTPTPLLNFEGLDYFATGAGASYPDTVGAVGPNHFVQMVSATAFAIWDKSGSLVQGATDITDLGTGTCSATNGQPMVRYDWLANRWILAHINDAQNSICFSVSLTDDPAGAYYNYQFLVTTGTIAQLKVGVWPDAYYIGVLENNNPSVIALDRNKMLTGGATTINRFTASGLAYPSLILPADMEGTQSPRAEVAGLFIRHRDDTTAGSGIDALELWEFDVDFDAPLNATFSHLVTLEMEPYTLPCFGLTGCIEQPDTSTGLQSLAEHPMFRVAYRNFGTHQTLLYNHTIEGANGQTGIRWYELRRSLSAPWDFYQQGTHAPDNHNRWLGSIAMDGDGNIALGYNVSSTTLYPSIRYATRLSTDPLNTLQAEVSLIEGSGSRNLRTGYWGQQSAMTLDPVDNCTFWFTSTYLATTGAEWRTRIGSFRIPQCGSSGATANLGIIQTDTPDPVELGNLLTYDLTIQNAGPDGANEVVVQNLLSARVDFVSATPSTGSCTNQANTVTCDLGFLAQGGSATIAIVVNPLVAGSIGNSVSVSGLEYDPNGRDNTAYEQTRVIDPALSYTIWLPVLAQP